MENSNQWHVEGMAFRQQELIYQISKAFPREETFSLTSQIRRSSRAVCACIAEAVGKKRYPAHLVSKLTDADAENRETKVWLEISEKCGYVFANELVNIKDLNTQISKLLYFMINHPQKFSQKKSNLPPHPNPSPFDEGPPSSP